MSYSPSRAKQVYHQSVKTTDATVTTIKTIPIKLVSVCTIKAFITGQRTGGSSGTAGDAAGYEIFAVVKNVAGTAALVGSVTVVAKEDQAAWDATVSVTGGTAIVTVAGAANNNVTWNAEITVGQNV